jgi:hypothetical protein
VQYNGSKWEWDIKKIGVCQMAGTIIDLLVENMNAMPVKCRKVRNFGTIEFFRRFGFFA